MNSKQRAYLKGLAQTIQPILNIGKSSLTPEFTESVAEALEAREIALAEGCSGIGKQNRQCRCFHAACCRTWRTADQHQKDYYAL